MEKMNFTLSVENNTGHEYKGPLKNLSLADVEIVVKSIEEATEKWENFEDRLINTGIESIEYKKRNEARKCLDTKNWYSLIISAYDSITITNDDGNIWHWSGGWEE